MQKQQKCPSKNTFWSQSIRAFDKPKHSPSVPYTNGINQKKLESCLVFIFQFFHLNFPPLVFSTLSIQFTTLKIQYFYILIDCFAILVRFFFFNIHTCVRCVAHFSIFSSYFVFLCLSHVLGTNQR